MSDTPEQWPDWPYASDDPGDWRYTGSHAFDGERCVHCGRNIYDIDYDDDGEDISGCVIHEPMIYTTETPEGGVSDGPLD